MLFASNKNFFGYVEGFERVMESQIKKHLDKYNILTPFRYGFRSLYSYSTVLLKITDDILTSTDEAKLMALVLLDNIDHHVLLGTLKHLGFSGSASSLLSSCLCDRKQRVELSNRIVSQPVNTHGGVPQGSILCHFLFSAYIAKDAYVMRYCR